MADSDVEINVDDVCDSMAADHGVEVQTILQGQASIAHQADDLDFMVQEEVETTTDGDALTVDLDPVDNVIIALQNTETLAAPGISHFEEPIQDGGEEKTRELAMCMAGELLAERKRKAPGSRGGASKVGGTSGGGQKRKAKRPKQRSVRFANRQIPGALATAALAKEAKEANEASFDPDKRPRKWKKRKFPVKTLDSDFSVNMWSPGTS